MRPLLSCDKVARKADRVSDAIAEILRQRDHPVVELQVDETFMRGLTRSLVAVPFVTADALARMCEPDSEQRIEHVLLEWWLALVLAKAKCTTLRYILPIFCGKVSNQRVGVTFLLPAAVPHPP